MRGLFISDLHLGSDFVNTTLMKNFLKAAKDWPLFLLGDIYDLWKPGTSDPEIVAMLRNNSVFLFPGNHDADLEKASLVSPAIFKHRSFRVNGKDVLLTHGDLFDSQYGSTSIKNRVWDRFLYRLSQLCRCDVRSKLNALTSYFYSDVSQYYDRATAFMVKERVDYLVYGHTHVPGIQQVNGKTLINLGSWYSKPHALFSTGGKYAFFEITETHLLPEDQDYHHSW